MKIAAFWLKCHWNIFAKGPLDNNPTLVQIMAWRRSGDKPLSEPMKISLPTHICVTRPQWVKPDNIFKLIFAWQYNIDPYFIWTQRTLSSIRRCFEIFTCIMSKGFNGIFLVWPRLNFSRVDKKDMQHVLLCTPGLQYQIHHLSKIYLKTLLVSFLF